jgi:hypothetical protein
MRPNKPLRYAMLAISVSIAMVTANAALAQGTDEGREYKCFADQADQDQVVFYYYDQAVWPDRFSDEDTMARARIPNSLRKSLSLIHECVLRELDFSNPVARTLEIEQPQ